MGVSPYFLGVSGYEQEAVGGARNKVNSCFIHVGYNVRRLGSISATAGPFWTQSFVRVKVELHACSWHKIYATAHVHDLYARALSKM